MIFDPPADAIIRAGDALLSPGQDGDVQHAAVRSLLTVFVVLPACKDVTTLSFYSCMNDINI
ncbi:MAG: hypothetical protein H7836_06985 [Magnetococcus sp. YQC-3]